LTFVWRHPKFYKRATNCRSDEMTPEAGSKDQATSNKQQAIDETVPYNDIEEAQASSHKPATNCRSDDMSQES
jgi:hypothetical protein